jgi:uncharacterized protein (DUF1330 family)
VEFMAVYMVIEIEIKDQSTYAEYLDKVPATVQSHGGRYLVRGGEVTTIGGDWHPERIIILEFPSMDDLRGWLSSPEYAELAPLRLRSTRSRAIAVEGCPPPV